MAMPAEGVASLYRNAIEDVVLFLKKHHDNNYMIWNLSEHEYDVEKFDNQVINCMFPDHHPPPFDRLLKVVTSIDNWLKADVANVAVIHCKGGKGRTGTVIVCALFFSGICASIEESDELFAKRRSGSGMGVTQPSQRRYIQYFNSVFMEDKYLNLQPICLKSVILDPMPIGQTYVLEIYDSVVDGNLIYRALHPPILPGTSSQVIHFDVNIDVQGDLYFKLLRKKRKTRESLEKEFHVCLNTMFIDTVTVELKKNEMDTIREKRYSDDLTLTFSFGPPAAEASHPTSDPLIDRMIQQFRKDDVYKRRRQAGQLTLRKAKSSADTKFIHPLLRTSGSHLTRIPSSPQLQQPSPSVAWTSVKIEQVSEMDASKFKSGSGGAASGWVSSRASGMITPTASRTNLLQQAAVPTTSSSAPTTPVSQPKSSAAVPPGGSPDMRQRSTNRNPPPPRARATMRPGSMQVAPGGLQLSETGDSFQQVDPTSIHPNRATTSSSSNSSPTEAHVRSVSMGAATSSNSTSTSSDTRSPEPETPSEADRTGSESSNTDTPDIAPLNPADNEFRSVLSALEAIGIAGASRVGTRSEDLAVLLGSQVEDDDIPPLPTGTLSFNSNPPSLNSSFLDVSAAVDSPTLGRAASPSPTSSPSSPPLVVEESSDTNLTPADVPQETQESEQFQEPQESQGPQESQEPQQPQESPEPQQPQESQEPQEPATEQTETAPAPAPVVPAFPSFPAFSFIPTNAFSQFIPKSAPVQPRKESSPVENAPVGGASAVLEETSEAPDETSPAAETTTVVDAGEENSDSPVESTHDDEASLLAQLDLLHEEVDAAAAVDLPAQEESDS